MFVGQPRAARNPAVREVSWKASPLLALAPKQTPLGSTFRGGFCKAFVECDKQSSPTKEQRDRAIGFGAAELGFQTLDKLRAYVEAHRCSTCKALLRR